MSIKKVSTRLGRGEKLIERITRELKIAQDLAVQSAIPVGIPAVEEVESRRKARRDKFSEANARIEALRSALATVRLARAEGNTTAGIWALLAEDAIAKEKVKYLTLLLDHANDENAVQVESLASIFAANQGHRFSHPTVRVLDADQIEALTKELAEAKVAVDKIGDQINDKNASTVLAFEIEESVAALIGL